MFCTCHAIPEAPGNKIVIKKKKKERLTLFVIYEYINLIELRKPKCKISQSVMRLKDCFTMILLLHSNKTRGKYFKSRD